MARFKTGFTLHGDGELLAVLRSLPVKVSNRILLKAVRAGAGPVVKSMRSMVAKSRGGQRALSKSIGIKTKAYGKNPNKTAVAIIGPRKDFWSTDPRGLPARPVKYAHLVEYGTQAHRIPNVTLVSTRGDRQILFTGTVDHPGARPHPGLVPGFSRAVPAAMRAMRYAMNERALAAMANVT